MEKLDTVYVLLGMLSEQDPMKVLEIDYCISNETHFFRVTDPWSRWSSSDRLEIDAAEKLREALGLDWPAILAAIDTQENPSGDTGRRVYDLGPACRGFKINVIDEVMQTESLQSFSIEISDQVPRAPAQCGTPNCHVQATDTCYLLHSQLGGGTHFAVLVRDDEDGSHCVGVATAYVEDPDRFSSEFRSLHHYVRKSSIASGFTFSRNTIRSNKFGWCAKIYALRRLLPVIHCYEVE
jgi:hypothetical protein